MRRSQDRNDRTELERRHSRRRESNPGNRTEDREPHHALNNPVAEPDPTEFPDPYERRQDPRDPERDEDAPRAPSTSDPHPPDFDEVKPAKGGEG
jgi:hypothetical protein